MIEIRRKLKVDELTEVIETYQDRLFSFAYFRTGSFDLAQDLVQDVFIKLYTRAGRFSPDNLKAYLFRSLYHACVDELRKERKNACVSLSEAEDVTNEEENACRREYGRIEEMLSGLPQEQQDVVRMKFVDNLDFVEMASILDLSVNTVKSRYRYALDHLRRKYPKDDL